MAQNKRQMKWQPSIATFAISVRNWRGGNYSPDLCTPWNWLTQRMTEYPPQKLSDPPDFTSRYKVLLDFVGDRRLFLDQSKLRHRITWKRRYPITWKWRYPITLQFGNWKMIGYHHFPGSLWWGVFCYIGKRPTTKKGQR